MRRLIVLSACLLTMSCSDEAPDTGNAASPERAIPVEQEAGGAATASDTGSMPAPAKLPAGQHCYFRDADDVTEALDITVTETGTVSGSNYGNIHQEENAYYASFDIELSAGRVTQDGMIEFDSVTQVDGDTQTGTMKWSITPEAAAPEGFLDEPMQPAECDGLLDRVFPQPGEE